MNRADGKGYSKRSMQRDDRSVLSPRTESARAFEGLADSIIYRWQTERDTWVSTTEIEHARAYLACIGVTSAELPDGKYSVQGESPGTVAAASLVLLGLKHVQASRRARPRF